MEETKENLENKNTEEVNEKKCTKKKKIIIAIIVAVILIATIIGLVFLLKKDKVKFDGESNGIEYSAQMQENSEVLVVMKNETGKTVSGLNLTVSYYDAEGKELAKRTASTDVYLKNEEISLNSIKSQIYKIDNIASYKVEIVPEFYEGEDKASNYEKIEISEIQELEDEVAVDVRNTSDEMVQHAVLYAVFFKDGKPIDFFAKDAYDLEGEARNIKFNKPADKDGNKIEYDFCEIYIKY